jgi:hypothetical protein
MIVTAYSCISGISLDIPFSNNRFRFNFFARGEKNKKNNKYIQ